MKLLSKLFIVLFFFLPSILWSSMFSNPSDYPKNVFFVVLGFALIITYVVALIRSKEIIITKSPISGALVLFVATYLISLWFSPNRVSSLTLPQGVATLVALTLVFLFFTGPFSPKAQDHTDRTIPLGVISLLAGSILSGLVSVFSYFVSLEPFFPKPFLPSGNQFTTLTLLVISLGFLSSYLYFSFKNRDQISSPGQAVSLLSLVVSLVLIVGFAWKLLPLNKSLTFLPYSAGWQIAADSLKNTPLWGRGPANFLDAFTASRPFELNLDSTLWNYRFFVSSNTPLHLLTTIGLLGFFAYLILIVVVLKQVLSSKEQLSSFGKAIAFALILSIALQFLIPPTLILWWIFFALLILFTLELKNLPSSPVRDVVVFSSSQEEKSEVPVATIVATILVVLTLPAAYFSGRAIFAELTYKKGVDAAVTNQILASYNLLLQTLSLNPYAEEYHTSYSQLNLAIANAIASGANQNAKTATESGLTDQDRSNISQLVQQSIREAKAAIALNPNSVPSWENLTTIYKALISFAQGADQWTIAAQKQVVILNPSDPTARLTLGGIYYSLGDYNDALLFFQQAADLKPDWPNSHYNLAAAYREMKNYGPAIVEMQQVLSLLPQGDNNTSQIKGELEALQKAAEATLSGRLKTQPLPINQEAFQALQGPQPLPTPVLTPPLDLNPNSGPATPTPTPSSLP